MNDLRHRAAILGTALAVLTTAGPVLAQDAIDPARYSSAISNPWLPLTPGTVLTYEGSIEGVPSTLVVSVTDQVRAIAGVDCLVVEELVSTAGRPIDRTLAYYAQDVDGNVWYFGEDVQELNRSGQVVNTEGWRTGIDGGTPSLVMEAVPVEGHTLVNASTNDRSEVVNLAKPVSTPSGDYPAALETKEWTPDEPDVLVNKYYVQDIGMVRDVTVEGGPEEFLLVDVAP